MPSVCVRTQAQTLRHQRLPVAAGLPELEEMQLLS